MYAAFAHVHALTLHDACPNSWSDTVRVQGPTGTTRVKGGGSGPAEDFLPVSEVEAGVNFRPAGGQVAGSLPGRQPGTGTRQVRGGAVTPSLRVEVPGIHFVSPGYGVNLNQYAGPGSLIRWHSDNEPLFGPQNSPKLIVSLSLGNSVESMVRRHAPGKVPSSIRLDHGDILVMDGLAQSEYEHRTVSGLQGPRVNLTYRLDCTTHCVLSTSRRSGLCTPNVCARFSRSRFPLVGRRVK